MKQLVSFICLILVASAPAAFAADGALTSDQVLRFAKTLPAVDVIGDKLTAEGKGDEMELAARPKAGEDFKPYSKAVAALKKSEPAHFASLKSAIKPHGFSVDNWGPIGDRVMMAYLAVTMEQEDPRTLAMMEGMDKSMLDMVPPEMRAQLETTFAMMETVRNVPEDDKAAVRPHKKMLDEVLSAQE